jgi:trehalose 6-phosphate synthase
LSRLLILSNRVHVPKAKKAKSGGLAIVLSESLKPPAIWFGWSGKKLPNPQVHTEQVRGIDYVLFDVTEAEYDSYYNGFYNNCIYPLLLYRPDLVKFRLENFNGYKSVCRRVALELASRIQRGDRIWVHDNHWMSCIRYLTPQLSGCTTSFFLHLPFPPADLFETLPVAREMIEDWLHFDIAGFQTDADRQNFLAAAERIASAKVSLDGATVRFKGRKCLTEVTPVGIDANQFAQKAIKNFDKEPAKGMRASLMGRKLIIGAERLDYSKGLSERVAAFGYFLESNPEYIKHVTFLQVASESRMDVRTYRDLKVDLDREIGNLNGKLGEVDWTPVRYLTKPLPRQHLAACFRSAAVGLVTPLRDGFNLVAEEYVAAQNENDPGVLILSKFAGASEVLKAAVFVNPQDRQSMSMALKLALSMPREERRQRWRELMQAIQSNSAKGWLDRNLTIMQQVQDAQLKTRVA